MKVIDTELFGTYLDVYIELWNEKLSKDATESYGASEYAYIMSTLITLKTIKTVVERASVDIEVKEN